jgi:hypothetical protein
MEEKTKPKSYRTYAFVIFALAVFAFAFYSGRKNTPQTQNNSSSQLSGGSEENQVQPEFLMVQEANKGTFQKNSDGTYTLALEDANPYTVYFSNAPEKIAGSVSTGDFTEAFNWKELPNAAIVIREGDEKEDVAVIQIIEKPQYDAGAKKLVYKAKMIGDYNGENLKYFYAKKDDSIPSSFGWVSLFLDNVGVTSCSGAHVQCYSTDICCTDPVAPQYDCGGMNVNECWSWNPLHFGCQPCKSPGSTCEVQFGSCCQGDCVYGCHSSGCPFH